MTAFPGLMPMAAAISSAFLFLALFLALLRLVKGPSLPDRVMAMDLVSSLVVGLIAVRAVSTGEGIYIRVAVAIALLGFVGTAAWAAYIRRRRIC